VTAQPSQVAWSLLRTCPADIISGRVFLEKISKEAQPTEVHYLKQKQFGIPSPVLQHSSLDKWLTKRTIFSLLLFEIYGGRN